MTELEKGKKLDNEKKTKSDEFKDKYKSAILSAYRDFSKLSKEEQSKYVVSENLLGKDRICAQFWLYLKGKLGKKVVEKIDKNLFKVYFDTISKKGFSFKSLTDDMWKDLLKSEKSEKYVISKSLKKFEKICKNINSDVFSSFAKYAKFDPKKYTINAESKFKTIEEIDQVWKKFLSSKKSPKLENKDKIELISFWEGISDNFDHTERMMVSVLINKISSQLNGKFLSKFKQQFSLPINALSGIQTLNGFANAWNAFMMLENIPSDVMDKIKSIIVTNSDIRQMMIKLGIVGNKATESNFAKWNLKMKTMFGNLLSGEYLIENEKVEEVINEKTEQMKDLFSSFSPYFNKIFDIFPYKSDLLEKNNKEIGKIKDEINVIARKINIGNIKDKEKQKLEKNMQEKQRKILELLWKEYIKTVKKEDEVIGNILQKLTDYKFDFSFLSQEEQQNLLNLLVDYQIDENIKNKMLELFGLTEGEFETFVKDLFDLEKKEIEIPTQNGPIKLKFLKKEFVGKPLEKIIDIKTLRELESFPMNFVVKNTEESEAFFDTNYWDYMFFDFNDQKISSDYKVKLKNKKGDIIGSGYISTYGEIDGYVLYDQPVLYPGQKRNIVLDKSQNQIIFSEDDMKNYDVVVDEKNINLNGDRISQLLFGFILGASSIKNVNQIEKNQAIVDTFENMEEDELQVNEGEENEGENNEGEENEGEENENIVKDNSSIKGSSDDNDKFKSSFLNKWESMLGNGDFVEGARILIKVGSSPLPPRHAPGNEWVWITIEKIKSNINKFVINLRGAHLNMNSKLEGKKMTLPMDKSVIDSWEKNFGRSSVHRVPAIDKNNNMEEQLDFIGTSGIKLSNLSMFKNELVYKNGKFEFKYPRDDPNKKGEVKYFSSRLVKQQEQDVWDPETEVIYEIKHNNDNTYTVKTSYIDEDADGGKNRFKYEKKMDYASFILFFADRDVSPETEESIKPKKEKAEEYNNDKIHKKMQWFSIGNIIKSVKDSVDKLKDQITKNDQEKTDDFMDIAFSQYGIYGKIGNIMPFSGLRESFTKMHYEFRNDRDNRVWNKIKYWSDIFVEDPHFSTLAGQYLNDRLSGKKKRLNRYQAAGAYLAFLKKGGMYNRHFAKNRVGKGNWVKMLLGEEHWKRFKKEQNAKQKLLEKQNNMSWIHAEATMDELIDMEVRYIASVIDGREYGPGMPEEKIQAAYWSRQYADEIQGAYDETKSMSKVNETYENWGNMGFEHAMHEFRRYITTGRPFKGLPFFKKMIDAVRTPQQKQLLNMTVTFLILSGFLNNFMGAEARKLVQQVCRSTGFYPGIVARDPRNQEYFSVLLKYATGGEFPNSLKHEVGPYGNTKRVSYNIQDFSLGNMGGADRLFDELKKWWLQGNGDKIDKFLDLSNPDYLDLLNDPKIDKRDKEILKMVLNKSMEADYETINNEAKGNFFISTDNPLNFSAAFTSKIMNISGKDFSGDDWEIEAQKEFWLSYADTIPSYNMGDNKQRLGFFLDRFFNSFGTIFDQNKRIDLVRAIKTCQELSRRGIPNVEQKIDYIFRYLIDGQVIAYYRGIPDELGGVISSFRKLFINNYKNIDTSVISYAESNLGGEDYLDVYKDPFEFMNMKIYNAKMGRTGANLGVSVEKEELRDSSKYLNPIIDKIESSLSGAGESVSIESDKTLWDYEFNKFMEENELISNN